MSRHLSEYNIEQWAGEIIDSLGRIADALESKVESDASITDLEPCTCRAGGLPGHYLQCPRADPPPPHVEPLVSDAELDAAWDLALASEVLKPAVGKLGGLLPLLQAAAKVRQATEGDTA